MAVTGLTANTTFQADLRDTDGNSIMAARITNAEGTYTTGGFVMNPVWFGLEEIEFLFIQSTIPYEIEGNNVILLQYGVKTETDENGHNVWKLLCFLKNNDGGYDELPNGTEMAMSESTQLIICIIGH